MSTAWRPIQAGEGALVDDFAGKDPRSGFMQSDFWVRFKLTEGYDATRLVYECEGAMLGCASLLQFNLLREPGFVICPEGPVLPWDDIATVRSALRALVELVKEMPNSLGLRIEPHLPKPLPSVLRNWGDAPTDLTPEDTLILDLAQSEAELLAKAHPKCRYNLHVADRDGIEITASQDISDVHRFYALMLETSGRTGFFVEPLGFFLNLFSTAFDRNAAELFLACHEGKLLAAIFVLYFGRRATYLYGASSSSGRNHMPAYPLHRAAMAQARVRGCIEYDMYGIDAFERRDHLYAGITRFKKQWGGSVHRRIGARDYIFYDRLADLMVERLSGTEETGVV